MRKQKAYNTNDELIKIATELKKYLRREKIIEYILGFLCYRYLSEKIQIAVNKSISETIISYEEAWEDIKLNVKLKEHLLDTLGYVIEPKNLFSEIIKSINENKFEILNLESAFKNLDTFFIDKSEEVFKDLFRNLELRKDISSKNEKNYIEVVKYIIMQISFLNIEMDSELENSYSKVCKNLINYFENKYKVDSQQFVPKEISKLLINLVECDNDYDKIYDPFCGIGSLLTINTVSKKIYGQEKNSNYYNLSKMNLLLQGLEYTDFNIMLGDIFENPGHMDKKFKAIVSNLVECGAWTGEFKYFDDYRFNEFPKLPPKSKAEYAFIGHMLYQLDEKGKLAVFVSHGALFRGANEGIIRKYLIEEKNYLDAIIGLPANLLSSTTIPTAIMIFNKGRNKEQDVMLIDASKEFEKTKNRNVLRECDIQKIVTTYDQRESIDKYSRRISLDEIKQNDCNLNIPRYIDTFEEEEEIDINNIRLEINELNEEILNLENQIEQCLKEIM